MTNATRVVRVHSSTVATEGMDTVMLAIGEHLHRADYEVRTIPLAIARELVVAHHYSRGGSNTATFRHGLFRLDAPDQCLGVAWWIPPTKTAAQSVDENWQQVINLTRLVIVPGVPTNAASYLLGRSISIIRRDGRYKTLLTYADEGQGHTGAIYRATNWTYVGTKAGDPVYLSPEGRHVARKAGGHTRTNAEMLHLGYVNTGRTRKHKFVMRIGNN